MFEQTFKNIDDVLWKEAGCTTELDYTEQTSWMLFLKYLDDLEQERAMEAELVGKSYEFIIDEKYHWSSWAAPKKADGSFDHDKALTGDDLIDYVDDDLFPYLKGFKQRATGPDTIEYKIGEIKNKFQSGYSLRDALELMDALRFRSQKEKHELSHLYEAKIKNMGSRYQSLHHAVDQLMAFPPKDEAALVVWCDKLRDRWDELNLEAPNVSREEDLPKLDKAVKPDAKSNYTSFAGTRDTEEIPNGEIEPGKKT